MLRPCQDCGNLGKIKGHDRCQKCYIRWRYRERKLKDNPAGGEGEEKKIRRKPGPKAGSKLKSSGRPPGSKVKIKRKKLVKKKRRRRSSAAGEKTPGRKVLKKGKPGRKKFKRAVGVGDLPKGEEFAGLWDLLPKTLKLPQPFKASPGLRLAPLKAEEGKDEDGEIEIEEEKDKCVVAKEEKREEQPGKEKAKEEEKVEEKRVVTPRRGTRTRAGQAEQNGEEALEIPAEIGIRRRRKRADIVESLRQETKKPRLRVRGGSKNEVVEEVNDEGPKEFFIPKVPKAVRAAETTKQEEEKGRAKEEGDVQGNKGENSVVKESEVAAERERIRKEQRARDAALKKEREAALREIKEREASERKRERERAAQEEWERARQEDVKNRKRASLEERERERAIQERERQIALQKGRQRIVAAAAAAAAKALQEKEMAAW